MNQPILRLSGRVEFNIEDKPPPEPDPKVLVLKVSNRVSIDEWYALIGSVESWELASNKLYETSNEILFVNL